MISIVVVSHSPALASAAVDLALAMVGEVRPRIAVAAGAGDGIIGTDAVAVAAAIDEVSSPDGVLVIMDLGSALMSAEMALDFVTTDAPVRLSAAPFVEGLLAAVVTAAGGASLDEVEREAGGALSSKAGILGTSAPSPESQITEPATGLSADVVVKMPSGLHARPAATLVSTAARFDATIMIARGGSAGAGVPAKSLLGLMSLNAKSGDILTVSVSGVEAAPALAQVEALFAEGFGELPE